MKKHLHIENQESASVLIERLSQHRLMQPLAALLRQMLDDSPLLQILMENDPALLHNKAAQNDNRVN